MAKLYGVDVFSGEDAHILDKISYDFAIIKVSGNPQKYEWDYVNPYADEQIKDCVEHKKLLGLYHFTWGKKDPCVEADFFIKQVKKLGYLGKAMLVIDYEAEAVERGKSWVKKFAERVEELAGYKPVLYSFSSCINEQKLWTLGYPIWCANYYRGYSIIHGYDTSGLKIGYSGAIMWQFTSSGRLKGYNGDLDLNVFFGNKDDFKKYMGAAEQKPAKKDGKKKPAKKSISAVAADVLADKYGKGEERKKKLKAAGYNYTAVQKKVNELVRAADDVIAGKYGNEPQRSKLLKAAGYDPKVVQKLVNERYE